MPDETETAPDAGGSLYRDNAKLVTETPVETAAEDAAPVAETNPEPTPEPPVA